MNVCSSNNTIDLRNSSELYKFVYFPNEWVVFGIVWPCLTLFGLAGNISFISTVVRTPSLHTSTYIYLVSLACNDLCAIIGLAIYSTPSYFNGPLRRNSYKENILISTVIPVIYVGSFLASSGLITLVAVERYLAICRPLKHYILKGTKRTFKLIAFVAILDVSISCSLIPFHLHKKSSYCLLWPEDRHYSNYPRVIWLSVSLAKWFNYIKVLSIGYHIFFSLLLVSHVFMYLKILVTLKRRRNSSTLQMTADFDRNLRQMGVMVIVTGTVYMMCYGVVITHRAIDALDLFDLHIFKDIIQVTVWDHFIGLTLAVNASVNPLIYTIINSYYRRCLKKTLLNCFHMSQTDAQ